MIRLHRTLGIGLGITALSLGWILNPLWAQEEAVTPAVALQEVQEKAPQADDEVEHVERAAAQSEETQDAAQNEKA
ncbi:MAG: hypothetical protein JKX85_09675 [Phycisphaeraceae bacterium]|nr:hypothetical protein [Phycisphaeraceae bacterium]